MKQRKLLILLAIIFFSLILLKVVGGQYANSVADQYRRLSLPERTLITGANWLSEYWIVIVILLAGAAAFVVFRQGARSTSAAAFSEEDDKTVITLIRLCQAYAADDKTSIAQLEPKATRIGEALDRKGGIQEMRKVFSKIPEMQGKRTLEMHWNGIGDWRG